jgi:hypothetical protein
MKYESFLLFFKIVILGFFKIFQGGKDNFKWGWIYKINKYLYFISLNFLEGSRAELADFGDHYS